MVAGQGSVRAMPVVVRGILVQDRPEMPWPGDQHPIGDLGPDCAYLDPGT